MRKKGLQTGETTHYGAVSPDNGFIFLEDNYFKGQK